MTFRWSSRGELTLESGRLRANSALLHVASCFALINRKNRNFLSFAFPTHPDHADVRTAPHGFRVHAPPPNPSRDPAVHGITVTARSLTPLSFARSPLLLPLSPQAQAAAWTPFPSPSTRPATKRAGTRERPNSSWRRCSSAWRAGASPCCSRWTGTPPATCGPAPMPTAMAMLVAPPKTKERRRS